MTAVTHRPRGDSIRIVGVGAAATAAILYVLIGLGVLSIGRSTDGGTPDLFAFGEIMGGTFVVVALMLAVVRSRVLWYAIAILQALVIVGYFAAAGLREPPFEVWGLLIKGCQVVVLGAVVWGLMLGRRREGSDV